MSQVLSYKKPSLRREKPDKRIPSSSELNTSSPRLPASNETQSSSPQNPVFQVDLAPPSPGIDSPSNAHSGVRHVLSRRKALQEFYHLQQQQQQKQQEQQQQQTHKDTEQDQQSYSQDVQSSTLNPQDSSSFNTSSSRKESLTRGINFDDTEQFEQFIKNTPIQDILKLRNSITTNLNSHDSERKAIIYDNYYELIKLNETLGSLSKPMVPSDDVNNFVGFKKTSTADEAQIKDTKIASNKSSLLDSLDDLQQFISNRTKTYHGNFPDVIKNLQQEYQDAPDSKDDSSVHGILNETDEILKFPDSIDKSRLITEINQILSNNINMEQSKKAQLNAEIEKIISNLNPEKDELLIVQLRSIKNSLE